MAIISVALRVLPSGKAVASQATIRGFESHHPLNADEPLRYRSGFLCIEGWYDPCKDAGEESFAMVVLRGACLKALKL